MALSLSAGLAGFLLSVWRWRRLLSDVGAPLAMAPLCWCRAAAQTVSSMVPTGRLMGEPLRVLLAVRAGASIAVALATVAVDRTLEFGASAPFACVYMGALVGAGIHEADRAFASVTAGTVALAIGVWVAHRRLRMGRGVVSAFARAARLDRLPAVRDRLGAIEDAERVTVVLTADRGRLGRAFAAGLLANVANFLEYQWLLAAFGLPAAPFYVVAAIVAAEVSRSLPVPASIGVMEGAEVWLFSVLGFGPEVGAAVGLAIRLRELVWIAPGAVYLWLRGVRRTPDDAGAFTVA